MFQVLSAAPAAHRSCCVSCGDHSNPTRGSNPAWIVFLVSCTLCASPLLQPDTPWCMDPSGQSFPLQVEQLFVPPKSPLTLETWRAARWGQHECGSEVFVAPENPKASSHLLWQWWAQRRGTGWDWHPGSTFLTELWAWGRDLIFSRWLSGNTLPISYYCLNNREGSAAGLSYIWGTPQGTSQIWYRARQLGQVIVKSLSGRIQFSFCPRVVRSCGKIQITCLEIGNAQKRNVTESVPGQHLCIDLPAMMGPLGRKTHVQMFAGLES